VRVGVGSKERRKPIETEEGAEGRIKKASAEILS
jgi:hypothetical protein